MIKENKSNSNEFSFTKPESYLEKSINQIPRLLSLQDRNRFSSTYGCFHRDYWLDKTSDFPDAVRQFGVQSLALVYKNKMPGNPYFDQEKIKDWAIAGLKFWAKIQHRDGSFDEFYPYERGWVGPTAFTTFTSVEAYKLLKQDMELDDINMLESVFRKAAYFISEGESEEDHLANHHAMAALAVWKVSEILGDNQLKSNYEKLFEGFKKYHINDEGWSIEYDGIDPGYLSATVSFLAKIYQTNPDPEILEIAKKSIEMCSYFVYPNGFYAGSAGSRNTLHFYSHGFEVFAEEVPLAMSIAEKMLKALSENKLVPPEIISDRYVFYRVPEYLQSYLDYKQRQINSPKIPYEKSSFTKYFDKAKVFVSKRDDKYILCNLAKGGVVKVFCTNTNKILHNDCGIIGKLENNDIVTSQWVDPDYTYKTNPDGCEISGRFNKVPSNKLFTPIKNIIFRSVLVLLGWSPTFSHYLKAKIRKTLILGQRNVPLQFTRSLHISDSGTVKLIDDLNIVGKIKIKDLSIGDEFFVRYVPQSRYFQSQELEVSGNSLDNEEINTLNKVGNYKREKLLS